MSIPSKLEGRVSGTVVFTNQSGQVQPAAGAVVSIAGTLQRAVATREGVFTLAPILTNTGALVITHDVDGDGAPDLGRSLDFQAFTIAPNHETALGQVSLRASATLAGKVVLQGGGSSSNAGTDVFVPGLPVAARTSDTGAFVLTGVPEGLVSVVASHSGYTTGRLTDVQVTSGAVVALAALTLTPAPVELATLTGDVTLRPQGDLSTVSVLALGAQTTTLAVGAGGRFEAKVPSGRLTVLARAPGYSDAILPNLLAVPGAVLEVTGALTLAAGDFRFDAGTSGGPMNLTCGDAVVGGDEVCDDGNTADGDGCSGRCVLESQSAGLGTCLVPSRVRLVALKGGQFGAKLSFPESVGQGSMASACGFFGETAMVLSLPVRGRVSVVSGPYLSLRGTVCSLDELDCGHTFTSGVLGAGDIVFGIEANGGRFGELIVTPVDAGPYCGDGVVAVNEACDDGNVATHDGCSSGCTLEFYPVSTFCNQAPLLALVPVGPKLLGARFFDSQVPGADATVSATCFSTPAQGGSNVFRLQLPARGDLRIEVTATSGTRPNYAVAVASGSCQTPIELGCSAGLQAGAVAHQASSLDAGVYFVFINGAPNTGMFSGTVSFELTQ